MAGGLAGLVVAWWLPPALLAVVDTQTGINVAPDASVFVYVLAVAWASACLFGVTPALAATRIDLMSIMRAESATLWGRLKLASLRRGLVSAQVAACLLLLVIGSLLVRGVLFARHVDPGFAVTDVLAVDLEIPQQGYTAVRVAGLYRGIVSRLTTIEGVQGVALTASLPWLERTQSSVTPDDGALTAAIPVLFNVVSPDYFSTMNMPIRKGVTFTDRPTPQGAATPVVVSEQMAATLWPQADPLGRRFSDERRSYEVVGVARDVNSVSMAERDGPLFYAPADTSQAGLSIVVRAPRRSAAIAAAVPSLIRGLDPQVLATASSLDDRIDRITESSRTAALVSALLGLFGLVLALVGVYGLLNYVVQMRSREMAVRLAVGATPADIVSLVMRQGVRPLLLGLAIGTALALGASQLVKSMLFGASEFDPVSFVGMTLAIGIVAAAAMYVPARRASRLDPTLTLRAE